MEVKASKNGYWFFVFCVIIALVSCVIAGMGGAKADNRNAAIASRITAVETGVSVATAKAERAVSDAQAASASARSAADEAARANTIVPPAVTATPSLSSWATCYGIAPVNGSFRLDCTRKD